MSSSLPPSRRWLNETLYTSTGEDAFALLQSEPELFQQYHEVVPMPPARLHGCTCASQGPVLPR